MSEARVGRPTVIVRMLLRNGQGDVLPFCGGTRADFFISRKSADFLSFRGRTGRMATARLNKRTGCDSPRCRHCKCQGVLPSVKTGHWRIPRRQTGRRLRHKSGDLRKRYICFSPGCWARADNFDAEKRLRQSDEWTAAAFSMTEGGRENHADSKQKRDL